jgi:putative aldouronate transport system permease protein
MSGIAHLHGAGEVARPGAMKGTRRQLLARIRNYRALYLFLLPGAAIFIIFSYLPMFGLTMVFQQYDPISGFLGSHWVGVANFQRLFSSPVFARAMRNTIVISLLKLVIEFPLPILFALFLNELRGVVFLKTVQTISYLPNFVSWVIVSGIWYNMLSGDGGVLNQALIRLGIVKEPILFMQSSGWFYPVIIFTDIWKNLGFQTIFYLAAIASIDQDLYEASVIDGAGKVRQAISITLPGIKSTVVLLFILALSGLLNAGFDQLWTMGNLAVREVGDILDTAVLRTLMQGSFQDLSVGAAMGFFKSVAGLALFLLANSIARLLREESVL